MFHKSVITLMVAIAAQSPAAIAQLEDSDSEEIPSSGNQSGLPIKIFADAVDVNPNTNLSSYSGNVELSQGAMQLTADSLTATVKDKKLDRLVAKGKPARFVSQLADGRPVEGQAQSIDFQAAAEILVLKGDGLLKQSGNSINNDRIEFNLKTGHFNAGGAASSGRVEVILQPAVE